MAESMKISLVSHLLSLKKSNHKGLAILIDPDKVSDGHINILTSYAEACQATFFLVGGSLVKDLSIHHLIPELKQKTHLPVVIFPGSTHQISKDADGILFLSLISGRNPDLLIGKHVEAAPLLKRCEIEVISTGYMLIDSGKYTTAHYISNTLPIPRDKADIAAYTALAGQYLGMKWIYLDGGSGAEYPIPPEMIRAVYNEISIPLIVGGGIKTVEDAHRAWEAGADVVVMGSALENDQDSSLMKEIAKYRTQSSLPLS